MELSSFTKFISKWITDLKENDKTIKFLKITQEKNLGDFGFGNEFSDITPKAQSMNESGTSLNLKTSALQKILIRE